MSKGSIWEEKRDMDMTVRWEMIRQDRRYTKKDKYMIGQGMQGLYKVIS